VLAGCSAQPSATYWNDKDNTVHHISGKVDTIESLTRDPVKNDAVGEGKFFQVKTSKGPVVATTSKSSDSDLKKKVARLTSRIEDLEDDLKRKPESTTKKESKLPVDQQNATADPDPTPAPTPADVVDGRPSQ
jgi:hypothetical protein